MRMPAFVMDEAALALKHWKRVFSAVSVSLFSQCHQVLSCKKQLFGQPARRISIKFAGRLRKPHKSLRPDKIFYNIMNQS